MVTEPGRTERIADKAWCVLTQDGALQRERHRLRQAPGEGLLVLAGQHLLHIIDGAIEQSVGAARFRQFGDEFLCRTRIAPDGAQDVEADDIAGALPD